MVCARKLIPALLLLSFVITNLIWFSSRFQTTNANFKFVNVTWKEQKLPAFVTGFSDNHMKEGVHLWMEDFVRTFGNSTKPILVFYDLGLNKNNMKKLKEKYGNRIQFRTFDFSSYPDFVKNLKEYRWKPLIVSECLKESLGVWWMESSVTFLKDFAQVYQGVVNLSETYGHRVQFRTFDFPIYPDFVKNSFQYRWKPLIVSECLKEVSPGMWWMDSSVTFLKDFAHVYKPSIYAATHPGLYKFLNISQEKSKFVRYGATTVIKNISSEFIINPFVDFALEKESMGPAGSELYCKFKDRMNDYQKENKRMLFPGERLNDIDRRVIELLAMPIPRPQDVP